MSESETLLEGTVTAIDPAGTFLKVQLQIQMEVMMMDQSVKTRTVQVESTECYPDIREMGIEVGSRVSVKQVEGYDFNEHGTLDAIYMIQSKIE